MDLLQLARYASTSTMLQVRYQRFRSKRRRLMNWKWTAIELGRIRRCMYSFPHDFQTLKI